MENTLISQDEAHILNANEVKELVIGRLVTDELITPEQGSDFVEKWQIIIIKPSWFKRWANKLNIIDNNKRYKIIKFED